MNKIKTVLINNKTNISQTYQKQLNNFLGHPLNQKADRFVILSKNQYLAFINAFKQNYFLKSTFTSFKAIAIGFLGGFLFMVASGVANEHLYDKYMFEDQIHKLLYQNFQVENRMIAAYDKILEDILMGGAQNTDAHMFASIGQTYAQIQNPEFAYHAYAIAHFKEPKQFKGNSDLKMDVIGKGQKKSQLQLNEGRDINELLDTMQE